MERWLPGLALVFGLFLMAAATFGQGIAPSAPEGGSSVTAAHRFGPGFHHSGGQDGRHHFMTHFKGIAPEQACKERFAREAGFLAYLGAKLDLNPQQQPLWDTYNKAMLDAAAKHRQTCLDNSITGDPHLTALERRDRLQKLLQDRVNGLLTTRPSLEALYQSLSQEQKRLVDQPSLWRPAPGR